MRLLGHTLRGRRHGSGRGGGIGKASGRPRARAPRAWRWLLRCCCGALAGRAAAGYDAPGLSFYEYETSPNCTPQVPWSYLTPVLAGRPGFYGTSGEGIFGTLARLSLPRAVALDAVRPIFHDSGEVLQAAEQRGLYVSDAGNHAVRLIDLATGLISTAAGVLGLAGAAGDGGPATAALLRGPFGLALGRAARRLYIADQGNHAVRCLDLDSGRLWTVAGLLGEPGASGDGGPAVNATLRAPTGLALDEFAHRLLVADAGNGAVRSLDLSTGVLDALQAVMSYPTGLALDMGAQLLYVADAGNHTVMKLELSGGGTGAEVVAGRPGVAGGRGNAASVVRGFEGNASDALLKSPHGLALDPVGQRLYIGDSANPAVRVVDLRTGRVSLAVGLGGFSDHRLMQDGMGPVGLALAENSIPGFRVLHIISNNFEGKQRYGKYFYFNSSNVAGFSSGVHRARQYRDNVLIWVGLVQFYNNAKHLGPQAQSCGPACTAQGVRFPEGSEQYRIPGVAEEGQWELGDIVLIPELHGEASQPIYMAEGHNFVVRTADIGSPVEPICNPGGLNGTVP